jgi:hypothetical protein
VDLSGFPYARLHLDRDAHLVSPSEVDGALSMVDQSGATDLLVLAHGWNNDEAEAGRLYAALAARFVEVRGRVAGLDQRRLALLGVLWPSKKFADAELIPGGAAAVRTGPSDGELRDGLAELAALVGRPVPAGAEAAVSRLDEEADARRTFADAVRELVAPADGADDDEETPPKLFALDGDELLDRFARPTLLRPPIRPRGGAASVGRGGAAGFSLPLPGGLRNAARNLLNFGTYYAMKDRAGKVGFEAVAPVLDRLHAGRPAVRLHLAGHSFGGRVATAAATRASAPTASLTLLQAAFSHYGFADDWEPGRDGLFREALTRHKVTGPVLVTHTGNDTAVGIAYALASRAAGQVAAGVGDAGDKYGGIGRNGAQHTPEAVAGTLLDVGGTYEFRAAGRVYNLLADRFVSGHSDVTGPEVAYALLTAVSQA